MVEQIEELRPELKVSLDRFLHSFLSPKHPLRKGGATANVFTDKNLQGSVSCLQIPDSTNKLAAVRFPGSPHSSGVHAES